MVGTELDISEIVRRLERMVVMLEILGANPFKARAFENGARAVESLGGELRQRIEAGTLTDVRGIGASLAKIIGEFVTTGTAKEYDELCAQVPATLLDLTQIPGLGPKKIKALYEQLGVQSIPELESAARAERVRTLKGFGVKSETEILGGIERLRKFQGRYRRDVAEAVAERFVLALRAAPGVERVELAGSYRRGLETVGDLDLLCATRDPEAARAAFLAVSGIREREAEGETKCRVIADEGIGVDLRLIAPASFTAALLYFTGSKEHNTRMRGIAKDRGLKLNEYGLWTADEKALPLADERAGYQHLGLEFVPAELREDRGEFEAAARGPLARLVELSDLRGTLHCHTTASDGRHTLREMAAAARALGWSYLGIADHSRSAAYAGGLSIERLRAQRVDIGALNREFADFKIFQGVESDILADGALDYPDDVLAELDYVVASVHAGFSQSRADQTQRIERALRHPATTVWGHPTGRLLLKRDGYDLDLDHLLAVAAAEGVIVEINASPYRLDLDWRWGERVRALSLLVGIHPDAHSTDGLADVRHGISTARKAGLTAAQVANTRELVEFSALMRRRRSR
ncbi:MAG: DNA polymerase/3'-5' exonuclease PolX [Planctomycetota bacterium]